MMVDAGFTNGVPAADDDGMHCSVHPYRTIPGGICPLCLQEKLGKLVSSSSSPSFRSDFTAAPSSTLSLSLPPAANRIPFLVANKKKKLSAADRGSSAALFKRSKSTSAAPRRARFLDADEASSPRKRSGFWSFLHLASSKTAARSSTNEDERKVSRSRSVGCGSRRFSGDFFERISTGFGDCTLRRVEGKPKPPSMKERVKCGGIFGGFITTPSSSSSSSSAEEGPLGHGRSRSWGWSPMRAFSKPNSGKRDIIRQASDTPNLAAIPSLLAARA